MADGAIGMNNREQVLQLLQAHVQSQKDAIKTLETKAMHNLTIVNIVAGIVAAFNLPFGAGEARLQQVYGERPIVYIIVIGFSVGVAGLCAFVAFLSIRTLWVREHRTHPMDPTEENAAAWTYCAPEYFPELMLKSYLSIYENNEEIVDKKGNIVRWSHRIIVAIIVLIFLGSLGSGLAYFLTV